MADSRKPDPDEPFRYVCPDCRSQVNGAQSSLAGYRCEHCQKTYSRSDLYDLKFDCIAGQRALAGDD